MKQKKLYSFITLLTAFLWLGSGNVWGETVDVSVGTNTNGNVPFNTSWADTQGTKSQFIYPKGQIEALQGASITALRFYANANLTFSNGSGTAPKIAVRMKEVDATTLSTFVASNTLTEVYNARPDKGTKELYLEFSTPFSYSNNNLLVEVEVVEGGGYSTSSWLGVSLESGTCYYHYNTSTSSAYLLPKTTFTYTAPSVSGPALKVYDGTTKLTSGHNYSFGLTDAGSTKTFTLKNPGTEATPISVTHTGSYGAALSAASIPTDGEVTLTITMPASSGSDVITISSTATGIDDFVINVSGTVKDPSKVWCNFSEGLPTGWTNSSYAISTSGAGDGTSGGGYAGQTNYSYIRMYTPKLKIAEGEKLYLLVAGYGTTASWNEMQIQYSADGSSWTTAKTVSNIAKGSWTSVEVTEVPAGTYYIGFYGRYVYFTDIYGGSIPTMPKNLEATSTTKNSATLSWTPAGSETAWKLQCTTNKSDWGSEIAASTNPFELTGLNPSTKYYVRVRADEAGSDWSDEADFRTDCDVITSSTWSEDFESATANELPFCWSAITVEGSTYPAIYASTSSSHRHNGSKGLLINNKHLKYGLAIFPEIANLNTLQVSFWHKEESSSASNCGNLELGYLTNAADSTTFHLIKKCDLTSEWAQVTDVNLSAVTSGARLAFRYIGKSTSYEYYTAVDDIAFSLAPACPKPTELGYSEKAAHSVKLSWTSDASAWKVQKSLDGTTWADGDIVTANTNPFVLTGLSESTHYYVRVKADCGTDGESDWTDDVIDFETPCEAVGLPFEEDFEDAISSCWKKDAKWVAYAYSSGHNNSASMRYTTGANADLKLPPIALNSDDAQISFWHLNTSMGFSVYVNSVTNANKLADYSTTSSYKKDSINLSAYKNQTVTLIFHAATASGTKYVYLDDISVDYLPVEKPTALAASATNGGANVTWNSTEGTSWNLRYREYNAEPEASWTVLENKTSGDAITGLTNGTTYEVQVQSVVSANRKSAWTESVNFTPENCASVESITFGTATYNSVVVNWTTSGAGTWDIHYKAAGDANWTSAGTGLNEATKTLTGLSTGVAYTVEVKASCGEAWLAAPAFTPVYSVPANVAVASITDAAASASWDAVADADSYQYIVLASGEPNWNSATPAAENSASLSGLTAGTAYTLYVRSVYSTGFSEAVTANFSTTTIAPQNLQQDGESTTTSATFTWEANGAATKYQWSTDNTNWSAAQTELTATAEGLNSGSNYTFYVRSYYSESVQSAAINLPFQTACGICSLPFSQDFGTVSGTKPNCWTIANWNATSANNWYTYDDFAKTGQALRYNARTLSSADAVSPSITIDDKALLKFYIKNSVGNNSAKVECKVLVNDGETTTEIAHITTRYTSATQLTYDLSAYKGKTVTIIFRGEGYDTSGSPYLWIDDITITYKPIAAPTALEAVAGDASATISWTDDVEAGPWDVRYRAYNAEPAAEWSEPISSANKEKVISGLTNGTEYEVQVRTHCSENRISAWTESVNFTPVACAAVSEVTFGDATYNSVAVNWAASAAGTFELQYKAGNAEWATASNAISALTYTLNGLTTGTAYSVRVKANCAEDWVEAATTFTPAYTAPANAAVASITDAAASASWDAVADAPNGYKYIVVEAGETPNWNDATATDELSASLSGLAGLTDYDFYVAAVYGEHVEAAAPVNFQTVAIAPTDLVQGEATTSSIAFSWSYAGAASQFQWKSSKEGSNWSEPISATNAEETGLTTGNNYTFYVRAYYADGKYSAELSETFGTECAVLALPFNQDFEDGVSPLCWTAATSTADYYDYDGNYGWKVKEDNDGNYVMRYKSGTALTMPALILPQVDLTGAVSPSLSFKVLNNYSNKTVASKVIVSAAEMSDLETVLTTSSSLTEQRIDLSSFAGKVITIKFQATSNTNGGRIDLDDIRISEYLNLADAVNNSATLSANLNKTVDVTIGRTFVRADYYNTICLPFSLSAEELAASPIATTDLWAFKYAKEENDELLFRIIEADHIEAGVPYFIGLAGEGNIVNPLFKDVTISATAGEKVGDASVAQLCGIVDQPETFIAGDQTKLFLAANNTLYWWEGTDNSQLNNFRAYFKVNTGSNAPIRHGMPARIIKGEQIATGIEDVRGDVQSLKLFENGQVVIIRNGVKYSVQGQVISK